MHSLRRFILEILSGNVPFGRYDSWQQAAAIRAIMRGERPPTRPTQSPEGILYDSTWRVAEIAWAQDPSRRPPISKLVLDLQPPRDTPSTLPIAIGLDCCTLALRLVHLPLFPSSFSAANSWTSCGQLKECATHIVRQR